MANSLSTHIENLSHSVQNENVQEAIVVLNVDTGKFVGCNANAAKFFNISEEELQRKGLLDLSPEIVFGQKASSFAKKFIDEALNGGNPIFDWVHLDGSGNALPCEVRLVRSPPYDQRFIKGFLIHKSDQRRKELSKIQNEERLQVALRATQTGYTDLYPADGRLYWDERMHELVGLPMDSKQEKTEYFFSVLHPDDADRITKGFEELFSPTYTSDTFEGEYRIIKDGKIVHVATMGVLIRNEKGEVQRVFSTNRNVTHRKLAEKALQESEQHFRALFEQPNFPIFIHDLKGNFLDANQKMLDTFGYSKEEFKTLSVNDIIPPNDAAKEKAQLSLKTLLEKGSVQFESIGKKKSGKEFHFEVNSSIIEVGGRQFVYGSGVDMTQLKKVEAMLLHQTTLMENLSDAVIIIDNEYHIKSWNRAAEELYGWTAKETEGKHLGEVIEIIYLNQTREEVFTAFTEAGTWKGEVIQKNKKGEDLNIQSSVASLKSPDGTQVGMVAINRDITHRVRTEEELRESENRFRSVFNQQFQMMAILSLEGRILDINNLPLRIQGTSQEDYIGRYFWDSPSWKQLPDWQKIIKNQVLLAPTLDQPLHTVDLYQTTGGDLRYIESAYSVVRDSDNELQFILVQASDITERKLAEEKLQKTKKNLAEITERFQLSTKSSRIGIWDWNLKNSQLIWDDTMFELFQIPNDHSQLVYEDWASTVHRDDIENLQNEVERALRGEIDFSAEFRVIWPDHSIRFMKGMGAVHRDSAGNPVRMVGTNWDITKEREAEFQQNYAAQLELKNKELEQFAYVASHDLKEPIRSVKGFADLLHKRYREKLDDDATEYLKFISQAASRMDNLVKALLDYSRIGRNKELTSVDCDEVMKEILHDLAAQISDSNATFHTDSLPVINGYKTEIRVLFQNLVSNAIKYSKQGTSPVITISVEKMLNHWKFCIADNGIGISLNTKKKYSSFFSAYTQKQTMKERASGLPIAKKL